MTHLWEAARLWLWIHPWYHSTILFGAPVLISTILGLWGLHHSREANRLSGENNRLNGEANELRAEAVRVGGEQKNSVIRIEQLQGERNKLQTELNELQAKRNVSLDQIVVGMRRDPTPAEKTAAKIRNHIGDRAYVTNHDGTSWGSMGAIIAEVNDDIVTLFTPASQNSSRALANFGQCDRLQFLEVAIGGCPVHIKILEPFGSPVDYGEAKTWAERGGTPTTALPRGKNVFSATYRKEGIGPKRGIYVYDPTNSNPNFSLVTRDQDGQEETGVWYCNGVKELATKFNVIQLEWVTDKWRWDGGSDNKALFLFTK
jgi:hypothetical protein